MRRRACAALLVSVFATAAGSQGPSQRSTLALAVVESSGTLVPIGRFIDDRWHAAWPRVDEDRIPRSLDAIPKTWLGIAVPREWTSWPTDGGPPAQLSIVAPVYAGACVGTVGFTTTAGENTGVGIAVDARSAEVRPLVAMAPDDPAVAPLVEVARNALREALPREAATWKATFGARELLPSSRANEVVELLTGRTVGSRTVAFARLTAVHDSVPLVEGRFALGVRLTVWLEDDGGGPRLIASEAESFAPDEDKSHVRHPLGIVTVAGREFWVLEQINYESRAIGIVEVSPGQVIERVAEAFESGC